MTLEFSTSEDKKINFTTKLTLILFAIFASSIIITLSLKILDTWGILIGIIISLALGYFLRTKSPKKSYRSYVGICLIISTIVITVLALIFIFVAKSMISDVIQLG